MFRASVSRGWHAVVPWVVVPGGGVTETVGGALEAGWRRVGFQRSTPPRGGLVTPGHMQMDGID